MAMPFLEGQDLYFSYRPHTPMVLQSLSFQVYPGEFVGLLGPNGSGKTTLVKLLSGVLRPTKGQVKVNNSPLQHLSPRQVARLTAVVSQENTIIFPFTALEIILMGRAPYLSTWGFESEQDIHIAQQAMELTGTVPFAHRLVSELSGGEKQRVFIARALAQRPSILLLDEPTAFLDLRHQIEIYTLLAHLNLREDLTILTVSHDLNLAAQYCQRLIFLKDGLMYADGPPDSVLTAETILAVYEVEVSVEKHPTTGRPFILPVSSPTPHQEASLPFSVRE